MNQLTDRERNCKYCSKAFLLNKTGMRLFCSKQCKQKNDYYKYGVAYRQHGKGQATGFISRLKQRYNLTLEDYNELLSKQNNSCAICKGTESSGRGSWHVDHCHYTGKVRGLLCSKCNQGLGLFDDNPELLAKARKYLINDENPCSS